MADYRVHGVHSALLRRARAKAHAEGLSLSKAWIACLTEWVDRKDIAMPDVTSALEFRIEYRFLEDGIDGQIYQRMFGIAPLGDYEAEFQRLMTLDGYKLGDWIVTAVTRLS